MVNDWNADEVKRAEQTWGHIFHPYTIDLFRFALANGDSYLDLGCGFGRFLEFLMDHKIEPDYIGYDSSPAMIERIRERFPEYSIRTFVRSITDKITHDQEVVIASAVFVHLTVTDQVKILTNIKAANPIAFAFDINCPTKSELDRLKIKQTESYERVIMRAGFRMTWQNPLVMAERLLTMFPKFKLTQTFYDIKQGRYKVMNFLERIN